MSRVGPILTLYCLRERSKEHEQRGSSQRGSQGGQYEERGPGSGGALKKNDTVSLVGFGTFKVGQRKARKGRNPRIGEEIKVMVKKVPKFFPGMKIVRWDVGSETTCDLFQYFKLLLSRIVLYDILLAGNRIKVDFFTSFFLILPVFRPLTVEWA